MPIPSPAEILRFWREAGPDRWFAKDDAFDHAIRERFEPVWGAAAAGDLDGWTSTPDGALALVIALDQFPRNLFRGSADAFATDEQARRIAGEALARGDDARVDPALRAFFYLPFMHSEDMADQEHCVALYAAAGDAGGLEWARMHREIIARFGRFPHLNAALGRDTTPAEAEFLAGDGFKG